MSFTVYESGDLKEALDQVHSTSYDLEDRIFDMKFVAGDINYITEDDYYTIYELFEETSGKLVNSIKYFLETLYDLDFNQHIDSDIRHKFLNQVDETIENDYKASKVKDEFINKLKEVMKEYKKQD